MNVNISTMTLDDLNNIKDILITEFDDFWTYSILKSELENPLSQYIVAKVDGQIIGFSGILDTVDQMEITNIVVKKSMRQKGIGNLLLKELIILSNGKSNIFLEVNAKNINAIKLYEKNGFKNCGIRKKYYNGTDDAILMKLELN